MTDEEMNEKPVLLPPSFAGRGIMVIGFLIVNIGFCVLLDTVHLGFSKGLIGMGTLLFFAGHALHFMIMRRYRARGVRQVNAEVSPLEHSMRAVLWVVAFLFVAQPVGAALKAVDQMREVDRALKGYHKGGKGKELSAVQVKENEKLKERILKEDFDLREMCRLALENTWSKISVQKQREFVDLFTQLLMRNAILHSEKYSGEEKIEYLAEVPVTEMKGRLQVKTRVTVPAEAIDFDIDYAMLYDQQKKRWRVYDIILDEESLMLNYRDQFRQIIAKHSYDYLVQRMRKKLDDKQSKSTGSKGESESLTP